MTTEEIREAAKVMEAYANGKKIQYLNGIDGWIETSLPLFNWAKHIYRVKPEPKCRPFRSQEECWNEMLKHQPFGWLKSIKKQEKVHIGRVEDEDCLLITLSINEGMNYSSSYLFDRYTFDDGTPFGIKEE